MRGAYWAFIVPLPSPIDEFAHYSYVQQLAEDHRPPVVGKDKVTSAALDVLKDSRSSAWRSAAASRSPQDPAYGLVAESYEGVQPPLYYALLAPVFALTKSFGSMTALFALRLATVLIGLAAIPVVYVLARRLFPNHPSVWIAAPAVLAASQGVNANLATLGNDGLAAVIGGLTLLPLARSLRHGLTWRGAIWTGVGIGAGLLTKSTSAMLAPLVAIGVAVVWLLRRTSLGRAVGWLAIAAVISAVLVAPWLAWNLQHYGATSANKEVDAITGVFQPNYPRTLGGAYLHLKPAAVGFWDGQLLSSLWDRYTVFTFVALGLSLILGVVWALRRRRATEGLTFVWLGSAWPLAFVTMLAVIYGLFNGKSSVVGRHLYPVLLPCAIALVAGFLVTSRRWGTVALTVLLAAVLWQEAGQVDRFLVGSYTWQGVPGMRAVVDQSLADGFRSAAQVTVRPPCPAVALTFSFTGDPPPIDVVANGRRQHLEPIVVRPNAVYTIGRYELRPAVSSAIRVAFPESSRLNVTRREMSPRLAIVKAAGDPAARIYCRSSTDPAEARFEEVFGPDHGGRAPWTVVRGWPRAWAGLGVLAVAVALAHAVNETFRSRRGPRSPDRARSETPDGHTTPHGGTDVAV